MVKNMGIKSIRLISNNICYGPEPHKTDEVEQHLTVSGNGQVWFSARNYEQYCEGKGFCRKKHVDIGRWKAQFLIYQFDRIEVPTMVTDCGDYTLSIRYEDGSTKTIQGPLISEAVVIYYGKKVSLTKLLRRYIPVYSLWGFDNNMEPDYEGKKEIFKFAKKWRKKFLFGDVSIHEFEQQFGEECIALGFQMDTANEFNKVYPNCFSISQGNLDKIVSSINDLELLGSAVFSQWRYLTHWAYMYELNQSTCHWFEMALTQIAELTRKKG